MTTDLEQRLRLAFREDAQRARLVNPEGPADADERVRAPHHGSHATRWLVAAAVLIVAGVLGVVLMRDDGEGDRQVTTTPGPTEVNGSIVTGDGDGWPAGAAAPEHPDPRSAHRWNGFDPGSGSFLSSSEGRIRILDADGHDVADFSCGSTGCGYPVFGPGVDEVTLFTSAGPDRLDGRVTAWDGTVRDTVDFSAVFGDGANELLDQEWPLAWSPDGTRLAVGTVPGHGCDPVLDPCSPQVWSLDRHGRDPQLVYAAPADDRVDPATWQPPRIGDLAWSPDGRNLGVVVSQEPLGAPVWPTLVVLRFRPDGTARADTLHDYDRPGPADSYLIQMWYTETFPFAWSPDGTRIAVAGESGVEEISAEDGHVLARHPGLGVDHEGHSDDVAWLPAS